MRLEHLRTLIREEFGKMEPRRLNSIYDSEFSELLAFANAYGKLGKEGRQHLRMLMDGDWEDMRPEVAGTLRGTVGGMNDEIDMALDSWEEEMGAQ